MRHIISLLMENEPGALSRVVGLFSQRGYNIESLTVAPTEDASLSRLTLTTLTVLLLGMGLAAALAWLTVERFYLASQRENLLAQARLTASALQGEVLPENPEPWKLHYVDTLGL